MLKLYEFYRDCGRSGNLHSLFISEEETVAKVMGQTVWFSEVLGKHSEIEVTLDPENLFVKSGDEAYITKTLEMFGRKSLIGVNPVELALEYLEESDEEG